MTALVATHLKVAIESEPMIHIIRSGEHEGMGVPRAETAEEQTLVVQEDVDALAGHLSLKKNERPVRIISRAMTSKWSRREPRCFYGDASSRQHQRLSQRAGKRLGRGPLIFRL